MNEKYSSENGKASRIILSGDRLRSLVQEQNFFIFGRGYVAIRFYRAIKVLGEEKHVRGFVTSRCANDYDGVPCITIDKLSLRNNEKLLLAVHDANVSEIEQTFKNYGITNWIWIYPSLYEFILGKPIRKNILINVHDIWNVKSQQNHLVARYLVLEQYYGRNTIGYDIYRKIIAIVSDMHTGENRLKRYLRLINDWEKNGADTIHPAKLFDDYTIIDGMHRIAYALFKGMKVISCDVYDRNKQLIPPHTNELYVTDEKCISCFTNREWKLFSNFREKIYEKIRREIL